MYLLDILVTSRKVSLKDLSYKFSLQQQTWLPKNLGKLGLFDHLNKPQSNGCTELKSFNETKGIVLEPLYISTVVYCEQHTANQQSAIKNTLGNTRRLGRTS
jgi:hypothetical protein